MASLRRRGSVNRATTFLLKMLSKIAYVIVKKEGKSMLLWWTLNFALV